MTSPMLSLNIKIQEFHEKRRAQAHGDKGAGLVEYGALIVLALAILGAIYASGITDTIQKELKSTVGSLFDPSDQDKPEPGGE